MTFMERTFSLAGLAAALVLSGCVASAPPARYGEAEYGYAQNATATGALAHVPLPTYYGLYAIEGGELVRLDGPPEWERSTWSTREDLPTDVSFILFSRQIGNASRGLNDLITVERVASVRYQRTASGQLITHAPGTVWASPNLPGYRIALEFEPVPGHPDMVIAKPQTLLPAGLYSLKLNGAETENSRFGVAWSRTQQSEYAARYCVEQDPNGYRPCGAVAPSSDTFATASRQGTSDFVVRGLHSSRVTNNDGAPELVIQGQLINNSPIPAIMPALTATLLDAQNQVLQALPAVSLPATPLGPGAAYNFRINVTNPAANASQVRVTPTA